MKSAVNALQNFGKSLYGPVLILPIVGLFIAFGNVLGNGNLAEYLPFLGHSSIQHTGVLISKSAVSVLANLALVFGVGIPIGLAAKDKGYAALIGLVTFIVFINAMNVTLQLQGELAPADQMRAAGQSMVLGVQVLERAYSPGSSLALFQDICTTDIRVYSFLVRWRFTPGTVLSPLSCFPSRCYSALS